MKLLFLFFILLQSVTATASLFNPRKLYDKVDRDWVHGGFVGVHVPWTCASGQNGSKSHLPDSADIKLYLNRLGDIGIKPDIFKTNNSLGNLFGKLFGRKNIIAQEGYKECLEDFLINVQVKLNEYQIQHCNEDLTKNPACQSTVKNLVEKVRTRALKSPFLKTPDALQSPKPEEPERTTQTQATRVEPDPEPKPGPETEPQPRIPSVKTHMGLMGGGGEPAGKTTIFDNFLEHLGRTNPKMSWDSSVSFNGGHSSTEALLTKAFPDKPVKPFSDSEFEDILKDYEGKIKSGAIKDGEQLLLMIHSHGSESLPSTQTHYISAGSGALTDYSTLKGAKSVSLDRLKALIELAEQKGVKLGIVDLSCHSGVSLSLASDKTCVVTATGPKHFAYAQSDSVFSSAFARDMRPGMTLEELYLKSRRNSTDNGFPMISSEAGRQIQDRLYPLISNYLHYYSTTQPTKFPSVLDEMNSKGSCSEEINQLNQILTLTKNVGEFLNTDFSDFEEAISNYSQYRQELLTQLDAMGAQGVNSTFRFCGPKSVVVTTDGCYEYSGRQLLSIDFDVIISASSEKPEAVDFWKTVKAKREELLTQYPGLKDLKNFYASVPDLSSKTYDLASKVTLEARKLYEKLYEAESQKASKPNPCKDFVL